MTNDCVLEGTSWIQELLLVFFPLFHIGIHNQGLKIQTDSTAVVTKEKGVP